MANAVPPVLMVTTATAVLAPNVTSVVTLAVVRDVINVFNVPVIGSWLVANVIRNVQKVFTNQSLAVKSVIITVKLVMVLVL